LHAGCIVRDGDLNVALDGLPRQEGSVESDDVGESLAAVSRSSAERTDLSGVSTGSDLRHDGARL
jgi:hypothetical protein